MWDGSGCCAISMAILPTDDPFNPRASNADLVAARNISFPAYGVSTNSGVFVKFFNDVAVTVSDKTLVSIDRQPEVAGSSQLISVGQQVEIDGALSVDTAGTSMALWHKRPTPRGVTAFQGPAALPADRSDADLEAL